MVEAGGLAALGWAARPASYASFHMLPLDSRGFAKEELHHRLGGTVMGLDTQPLMLSLCCAGTRLRISAPCQPCGQPSHTMKVRSGLASVTPDSEHSG